MVLGSHGARSANIVAKQIHDKSSGILLDHLGQRDEFLSSHGRVMDLCKRVLRADGQPNPD